jgi:hypothetical protein
MFVTKDELAPLTGICNGCERLIFEDDAYVEWAGCILMCEECDSAEEEEAK